MLGSFDPAAQALCIYIYIYITCIYIYIYTHRNPVFRAFVQFRVVGYTKIGTREPWPYVGIGASPENRKNATLPQRQELRV